MIFDSDQSFRRQVHGPLPVIDDGFCERSRLPPCCSLVEAIPGRPVTGSCNLASHLGESTDLAAENAEVGTRVRSFFNDKLADSK